MSESTPTDSPELWDPVIIELLKERSNKCPNFRVLVVGRTNARKTTMLEKICGVQQGTKPIIIRKGPALKATIPSLVHHIFGNRPKRTSGSVLSSCLKSLIYRGDHDIEGEVTYEGSNFIFHDSSGFEAGAVEEMNNQLLMFN